MRDKHVVSRRGFLETAGVALGTQYPRPIVDHAEARARFLATAARLRGGSSSSAVSERK